MLDEQLLLPVIDLHERYDRDGMMYLVGAFAGIKVSIHQIEDTPKDDRAWRVYLEPRAKAVLRDRHRPTRATPAPPPPPSMAGALASIGTAAQFYRDELGLADEDER